MTTSPTPQAGTGHVEPEFRFDQRTHPCGCVTYYDTLHDTSRTITACTDHALATARAGAAESSGSGLTLREEFLYRIRTALTHGLMRGKHGEQVEPGWAEREADAAVAARAAGDAAPTVTAEQVAGALIEHQPYQTTNGRYGCLACDRVVFSTWAGIAWHISRKTIRGDAAVQGLVVTPLQIARAIDPHTTDEGPIDRENWADAWRVLDLLAALGVTVEAAPRLVVTQEQIEALDEILIPILRYEGMHQSAALIRVREAVLAALGVTVEAGESR